MFLGIINGVLVGQNLRKTFKYYLRKCVVKKQIRFQCCLTKNTSKPDRPLISVSNATSLVKSV